MPEPILYEQVHDLLYQILGKKINQYTLERLTLLVLGIIRSRSASPAGIARVLDELGLDGFWERVDALISDQNRYDFDTA